MNPTRTIFITAAWILTVLIPASAVAAPEPDYDCTRSVPSNGATVSCPDAPPGVYRILCLGTWSHAAWYPGAVSDCAYSGEPNASWGSSCSIHPSGAPYGGHGIRVNGKQPFHANVTVGGENVSFLDATPVSTLTSTEVDCDWTAHDYNATLVCAAAACPLRFRIMDGVIPRDYGDNGGSLTIRVSSIAAPAESDAVLAEATRGLIEAAHERTRREITTALANETLELLDETLTATDELAGSIEEESTATRSALEGAREALATLLEARVGALAGAVADTRRAAVVAVESSGGAVLAGLEGIAHSVAAARDATLAAIVDAREATLAAIANARDDTIAAAREEGALTRAGVAADEARTQERVSESAAQILARIDSTDATSPLQVTLSPASAGAGGPSGAWLALVTLRGVRVPADITATLDGEAEKSVSVTATGAEGAYLVTLSSLDVGQLVPLVVDAEVGAHRGSAAVLVGNDLLASVGETIAVSGSREP